MSDLANTLKHVASPLARQTLLDRDLTRPVAGGRPIRLIPWLQVVILPTRPRATLILTKGADHVIETVALRRL